MSCLLKTESGSVFDNKEKEILEGEQMEYSIVTNGVLQEIDLILLQPSPLNTFDASDYYDLMCSIGC